MSLQFYCGCKFYWGHWSTYKCTTQRTQPAYIAIAIQVTEKTKCSQQSSMKNISKWMRVKLKKLGVIHVVIVYICKVP